MLAAHLTLRKALFPFFGALGTQMPESQAISHPTRYLEDRNLLKLRRLDSSCPFCISDNSIWDNELECSSCYDRKATIAFRTYKCCNR